MKRISVILVVTLFVSCMVLVEAGCSKQSLSTDKDKLSYSIGWDIGSNFKKQSIKVNVDILSSAIKDALSDSKSTLTDNEMQNVLSNFQNQMRAERQVKASKDGEMNAKEGKKFLEKNKKEKGIKVTESGLQYKVIKEGTGKSPSKADKVTVHYEGKLLDGTVFDSSYKRGEPATFPVSGVISGWTEALQLMKEGSKHELYIPSDLAYGERGAGGDIGPNATLIFTVELIMVEK